MPSTYHLQPDEWVVRKLDTGVWDGARVVMRNTQLELILTSRNLIVVSLSMQRKPKGSHSFPLEHIRVVGGRPQVFATGTYPMNVLEVHFHDGQQSFRFNSKDELRDWVDDIHKLTTGRADELGTATDFSSSGARTSGEPWKQTVDMFKASFGFPPKDDKRPVAVAVPERTARKCTSCSAPISGIVGRVVRCEYCQSDQQL